MPDHTQYDGLQRLIERRQHQLDERVATAIRSGDFWELIKAELARDYSSLFDGFLAYGTRIDGDYAAGRTEPRSQGKD